MKGNSIIYGGSFDPIHNGHVEIINKLKTKFKTIYLIPSINPWKKDYLLSIDERIFLLKILFKNDNCVKVLDIGKSSPYFTDYIVKLKTKNIALGSDSWNKVIDWKNCEKLKKYNFYIVKRDDEKILSHKGFKYSKINIEVENISSTNIKKEFKKLPNNFFNALIKTKTDMFPGIDVSVDSILLNEYNEVLLIKRGISSEVGFNQYALPGGFVDYDEKIKTAAIRELQEETNIKIKKIKYFTYFDDVNRDCRKRVISHVFYKKVKKKDIYYKETAEAIEITWVPITKIKKINMAFDHKKIIKEFKKRFV